MWISRLFMILSVIYGKIVLTILSMRDNEGRLSVHKFLLLRFRFIYERKGT
jgi:hypothetical protein